jgi:hypothetical protein
MLLHILEMFLSCYCYVLLRALQQRNVAFDNYLWIIPVSYLMASLDVFIVAFVAHLGWSIPIVLANGTGGFLGAISAMLFHKRWIKKKV